MAIIDTDVHMSAPPSLTAAAGIDAVSHALEAYASVEQLINAINAINEPKAKVGIKPTIRDYVPDEADFLNRLDDMAEQSFDDRCPGTNPRYPLMSKTKQMYANAYYGTPYSKKEKPNTIELLEKEKPKTVEVFTSGDVYNIKRQPTGIRTVLSVIRRQHNDTCQDYRGQRKQNSIS